MQTPTPTQTPTHAQTQTHMRSHVRPYILSGSLAVFEVIKFAFEEYVIQNKKQTHVSRNGNLCFSIQIWWKPTIWTFFRVLKRDATARLHCVFVWFLTTPDAELAGSSEFVMGQNVWFFISFCMILDIVRNFKWGVALYIYVYICIFTSITLHRGKRTLNSLG